MNNLQFPLKFRFKITTLSNDFVASDATGQTIAYVKQKMFKFVDEISVYNDDTKSQLQYTIKANKWLDFSAAYTFTNAMGLEIGRVVRKGWASIWKARYEIYDDKQHINLMIQEENPWAKVGDAVFGEIPVVGLLTGYIFNPSYKVMRDDGTIVVQLKKEPTFLGRQFNVIKVSEFKSGEEERVVLSLMMMILLERRRG